MTSNRTLFALLALIALTFAVFALWPGLDLWISGQFYDAGFVWDSAAPISQTLRGILWDLSILMPVLALAFLLVGLVWRPVLLPQRIWGFVLALFLIGPGLIVNGILKAHWGRARPFMVTEFGGTAHFTPPWQITDQCARNCSFVSGEGAGSMAMAISALLILFVLRHKLPTPGYRLGQGATLALLAFVGFQRVASGGHFLSDVLLSWLLTGVIALILARLMLRPSALATRP
jgi:lipid A 4'-phosphatase